MAAYNVNSGASFVGEAIGVSVEACSILSIFIESAVLWVPFILL
jgi:hypothetical protein